MELIQSVLLTFFLAIQFGPLIRSAPNLLIFSLHLAPYLVVLGQSLPTCTLHNTLLGFAICFIDEVSEVLAGYRARNWSFYPYIGH